MNLDNLVMALLWFGVCGIGGLGVVGIFLMVDSCIKNSVKNKLVIIVLLAIAIILFMIAKSHVTYDVYGYGIGIKTFFK